MRPARYFSIIQLSNSRVVLTGEEYGQYRVADPINGWQTVEKETFWSSFDAVGRRAVTIAGNEEALA